MHSELDLLQQTLITPRLELHHVNGTNLITLFENRDDSPILEKVDFTNPHRVLIDFQGPLRWRVPQVKADPSTNKWFLRLIVLKENREIIGSTSFHGVPDENGMIEIGLGIESEFHNQGFAKESLLAMWSWAIDQPGVKSFRYTVSPENAPSIKVIEYFGFPFVGVQIDEEDGPENIYEISVDDFKAKFAD
ncbi:MAG: N-acetyltransferase [Actinobacteria bacterium]|nr:N-acetyltransferase [Actinomycetota bacterium]